MTTKIKVEIIWLNDVSVSETFTIMQMAIDFLEYYIKIEPYTDYIRFDTVVETEKFKKSKLKI